LFLILVKSKFLIIYQIFNLLALTAYFFLFLIEFMVFF